jgi:hypothetical protein
MIQVRRDCAPGPNQLADVSPYVNGGSAIRV